MSLFSGNDIFDLLKMQKLLAVVTWEFICSFLIDDMPFICTWLGEKDMFSRSIVKVAFSGVKHTG